MVNLAKFIACVPSQGGAGVEEGRGGWRRGLPPPEATGTRHSDTALSGGEWAVLQFVQVCVVIIEVKKHKYNAEKGKSCV